MSSPTQEKNAPEPGKAEGSHSRKSEMCLAPSSSRRPQVLREKIDNDATKAFSDRDPPGQLCAYILSGDHRTELYRLATYARYPETAPVKSGDLAAAGLYYTGYKDRVKCFSCGLAVENWMQGDDVMDKQWHKSDCRLVKGTDKENVPLPSPNFRTLLRKHKGQSTSFQGEHSPRENAAAPGVDERFKSEAERRKTFLRWPNYPAPRLAGDLAKDGFFYLGNLDGAQCFSCVGILRNWSENDLVRDRHRKHFPTCRFLCDVNVENIPMTDPAREQAQQEERERLQQHDANQREQTSLSHDQQRHLAQAYPCNDPINLYMESLQARIATFDHGWPRSRVNATVENIAKAGFFFLGESDRTKCYYCNGGLQNWDPNDDPWTEHAKWFPRCEFVLRMKGVEFAKKITDDHPNLNRPCISNPVPFRVFPPRDVQASRDVSS